MMRRIMINRLAKEIWRGKILLHRRHSVILRIKKVFENIKQSVKVKKMY